MNKTKRCLSVLTVLTLVVSLMLPIVVHAEGYSNTFTPEFVDSFIRGDLIFNKNASSKTVDYINATPNNNYSEIGWHAGTSDEMWFQRYVDGYILTNVNNNTKVVVNMYEAATYLDKVIDIQYEYNNFNVGGHLNLPPIFAVQKNSVTNMTQNIYSQGITDYDVIVRFKDHATGNDISLSNAYVAFGFYNYREGTAFGTNIEKVLVKNDTVMSNFISDGVLFSQSGYLYSKNYFWPWLICVSQEDHLGREGYATQVKIKDNSSYFTYKIMPGNGYTMELNMTSDVNLMIQRGFAEVQFYDVDQNNKLLEQKVGYSGAHNQLITDVYTDRLNDINYYRNRGYELVTDGFDSNPKFVANQTTVVKIYLKHKTTDINEAKTITRTINYYKNNTSGGKLFDSNTQSTVFSRTNKKDEVTGVITNGTWSPASNYLAAVANPVHDEWYTDDADVARLSVSATTNSPITVNIIYKQYQYAKVVYLDETINNALLEESALMKGKQNANIDYSAANRISWYEDLGYELVSNEIATTQKFDTNSNTNQIFRVILKHTYTTVNKDTYENGKCLNNACTAVQPEKGC